MIAPDPAVSDFSLPTLELRSIARRALLPALLGAAVLAAVMFGSHRIHAVAAVLHRALGVNGWWTAAAVVFECVSVAGYVVLLASVAGGATPRVGMRQSAEIALAGTAATRLLPTAGAGGAGLTLWSLRRAGLSTAAATRTLLTFLVLLYAVFLGAIVLARSAAGDRCGPQPRSIRAQRDSRARCHPGDRRRACPRRPSAARARRCARWRGS